jgi:hypothetical protein
MKALEMLGAQALSPYCPGFVDNGLFIAQPSSHLQDKMEGENLIAAQTNSESWKWPLTSDSPAPEEFKIPGLRDSKKLKTPNMSGHDRIEQNIRVDGLISKKPNPQQGGKVQHGGGRTRHPGQDKDSTLIRKIRSLASLGDTKNSVLKSRANQASPFTVRDSGLYSGRRTPSSRGTSSIVRFRDSGVSQVESFAEMKAPTFLSRRASSTLNFRDSGISQAVSFTEFTGPYRVVCQTQHEPTIFLDQYRRVKPCMFCSYSNIHNLAWVASNFMLQDFKDELSFGVFYDFQALDAAGNTALHYAAASGASPSHLKALIVAGVPPYQQNTAKQNFLHCLRHNSDIDGWDPDCSEVNLIQLLDLLEPKVIFGQQDNYGQTVLHVLTSHVTEQEGRDQIIKKFTGSGFCLDIIDRFGRPAVAEHEHRRNEEPILEEIDEEFAILDGPMWFTEAVDYPGDAGDDTMGTSSFDLEVSGTSKWSNPFDAILKAHENPHSTDMITKDTVLHALSKVNVQTKGSMRSSDIINYLRSFVSKGVNLNWHNADGQTPLTAFICNKYFRGSETGATLAKYIDALWKDDGHVIHNDINVDMMNRRGATALYEAAVQALSDPVRSLLEAGANPNARLSKPYIHVPAKNWRSTNNSANRQ